MGNREIVVFRYRRSLRIGLWVETVGNKVRITTEKDRHFTVPESNILFRTGVVTRNYGTLDAFTKAVEARAEKIDLEAVWELVREEPEALTFTDLAELHWSENPDSTGYAAMLWHLNSELCCYFEPQESLFVPLSSEEVTEQKERQLRQQVQTQEEAAFSAWLMGTSEQPAPEAMSKRQKHWLERLQSYVLWGDSVGQGSWVRTFLEKLGGNSRDPHRRVFELLVDRGLWDPDENLDLVRYEVPVSFSPEVLEAAQAFQPDEVELTGSRRDLTDLPVFSIDDASTRDIDDALSLTITEAGYRLGIHIADPSVAVTSASLLDEAAAQRVCSLYFPETKIPMLPPVLSEDRCSLVEGRKRCAISLFVDFDRDFTQTDMGIVPSWIINRHRLTYEVVDGILVGESHPLAETISLINEIGQVFQRRRLEAGAVILDRPDLVVKVDENRKIELEVRLRNSLANQLVSEMMILVNSELARFCHNHDLPVIYRTQQPIEPPEEFYANEVIRHYQLFKRLRPSNLTLEPSPHHLLGVDLYGQFSSPLRRYIDLVLQRQLAHYLVHGHPLYTASQIATTLYQAEERLRELRRLEIRREQYWLLKYFARLVGQTFQAILLEVRDRNAPIELVDYPVRATVSLQYKAAAGDTITVQLTQVDLWENIMRFTQVRGT